MIANYHPDGVLPVTPTPEEFEPLLGYVLRVSELNGYRTPWHVFAHAGIEQGSMIRSTLDPAPLARILGKSPELLDLLPWSHWPNGDPVPEAGAGSATMRRLIDLQDPKVCPECIEERGAVEAAWDLKVMIACPIHRRLLITQCPVCDESITWFRRGLKQCRCGGELTTSAVPVSSAVADLLGIARSVLYGRPPHLVETTSGLPTWDLMALTPRHMLLLLRALRNALSPLSDTADPDTFTPANLEAVANFFADWPKGAHETLRQVPMPAGDVPSSTRKQFDRLVGFLKPIGGPQSPLGFVYHAIATYGTSRWNGVVTDPRTCHRVGVSEEQLRVGHLCTLGRRMGVDRRTAKKFVDAGLVPSRTIQLHRSTRQIVDLPDDLPIKTANGALPERDAAKHVGLPVSVLRALREKGVYKVLHFGRLFKQYHELDLTAMRHHFLEQAPVRLEDIPIGHTSVESLMRLKYKADGAKPAILIALSERRLVPLGRLGDAIGDLVVPLEEASQIATNHRAAHADGLPVSRAAQLIGCDQAVVPALGHDGHLQLERHGYETLVDANSLWEFACQFVPVAALAKDRRQSSRALTRKLIAAGAKLLFVPRSTCESPQPFLVIGGETIERSHRAVDAA